ncbi:MAG: alpha/beta hydrolase [Ilumatobacteraceae bacterium]
MGVGRLMTTVLVAGATVSACGLAGGVTTHEASQHVEDVTSRMPPTTEPETSAPTISWSHCDDIDGALSLEWECASVPVPLDHDDPTGEQISIAVTRPVLEPGDDRAPLVMNPGGPGAQGVPLAWYLVDQLPFDLLDHFYPVGWDPRGVGRSVPAVDCGSFDLADHPDADECIAGTGPLLDELGAADAALDLENLRLALGVERLDYLGYSYGTALGAVYAMAYPEHVGRFVLDGAIDPDAGDAAGAGPVRGPPGYATDGIDDAIARFHELCDETIECAAGPDSATLVDDLRSSIAALPTTDFPGGPTHIDRLDLDDVLAGATFDPWSWPSVGDALRDAAAGNAATLAALLSYQRNGYPPMPVADDEALADAAAFFAISCADFSADIPPSGCDGMPRADPLPVIGAVDTPEPILVIGTEHDPATPGHLAGEMANALDDAVTVTWEGIGHTAFPVNHCVDDAVTTYLVDGTPPADGVLCAMVDGVRDGPDLAGHLFEYQGWWVEPLLVEVFVAEGASDRVATCMGRRLAGADHRIITHLLLGVRSVDVDAARAAATRSC